MRENAHHRSINDEDLDGPFIDRRTTVKLLGTSAAGLAASMAGCATENGGDGTADNNGGGGTADNDGPTASDSEGDSSSRVGGKIEAAWVVSGMENLDPHLAQSGMGIQTFPNFFNNLVRIHPGPEIGPDLAKDWTVENQTRWEFKLREGFKFHHGEPVDAQAVKWSFERVMGMDESPHQGSVSVIDTIETPDDYTIVLNLKRPFAPFLVNIVNGPGRAGAIVPKGPVEDDSDEFTRKPVGSGPFKVVERERGTNIRLQAFEDYPLTDDDGNQIPYLDEINIRFIPEGNTVWSAMQSDSIHYTTGMTGAIAKQAENIDKIDLMSDIKYANFVGLSLQANDPAEYPEEMKVVAGTAPENITDRWQDRDMPTKDPKVRRAISMGIDREAIVEKAFAGFAQPAHMTPNPGFAAPPGLYQEKPEDSPAYLNPEKAKQLLADAGYPDGFDARAIIQQDDKRMATVLQQQLKENLDINLELDIMESGSYWDIIYHFKHMFKIYGATTDLDPHMTWYRQLMTPTGEGSQGTWQKNLWWDKKFDELIHEMNQTLPATSEERLNVAKEAQKILYEEQPWVPLVYPKRPRLKSANLKNPLTDAGLSDLSQAYLE